MSYGIGLSLRSSVFVGWAIFLIVSGYLVSTTQCALNLWLQYGHNIKNADNVLFSLDCFEFILLPLLNILLGISILRLFFTQGRLSQMRQL